MGELSRGPAPVLAALAPPPLLSAYAHREILRFGPEISHRELEDPSYRATAAVMNAAAQGDKALSSSNLPLAIQHFTQALTELPRAPAYYISRSTAYTRLKPADGGPNPQAALRDAEIGLTLARERGKRELMLSAQMRRAISLYQLGRYGDAAFVLGIVDEKAGASSLPEDKSAGIQAAMSGQKKGIFGSELPVWLAKVRRTIRGLPEEDEKLVVSVVEIPTDVHIPTEAELKAELEAIMSGKGVGAVETAQEDVSKAAAVSASSDAAGSSAARAQSANAGADTSGAAAASGAAPEKVRHEWYQSQDSVVVTLYIKGIPKDSVTTDLKDDSVSHISNLLVVFESGANQATGLSAIPSPIWLRI